MTIPGWAPSTPACQDPSVLASLPFSYSAVSSPKYQTFPFASCVYQSSVFSRSVPPCVAVSSTTTHGIPRTTLVRRVTTTSSRWLSPSFTPSYTKVVPGFSGKKGLSIVETKFARSMTGRYPESVAEGAVSCLFGDDPPAAGPVDDVQAPATRVAAARINVAVPSGLQRMAPSFARPGDRFRPDPATRILRGR